MIALSCSNKRETNEAERKLSDMTTFCSQHRSNMRAIHIKMEDNLFMRRWLLVVVLWICPSAVRRQEQGEVEEGITSKQ